MTTDIYKKSLTDFIDQINYCCNNPSGPFKLYLKQWAFDLFMKHHLLDSFPADKIVITPDMIMG